MDYAELVKDLLHCATSSEACASCNRKNERHCQGHLHAEAADAIETLQGKFFLMKKTAEFVAEKVPKWIPATERLPEPYTWVLVYAEKHKVAFDAFYDGAQWKDAVLNGLIVTHWMPLPELPKEENK